MADQEESAGKAQALVTVDVSTLRKRRGVLRGSITRIDTRIQELEDNGAQPDTFDRAQQLITKLEALDRDFKKLHMQVVDHLDQEEELEKEQLVLDDHDDKVSNQLLRLQKLCDAVKSPVDSPTRNLLSRKLSHLEKLLATAHTAITGIPDEDGDRTLILQYEEHLKTYKSELATIYQEIIEADIPEDDALCRLHSSLEDYIFQCSHRVRKLLSPRETPATTTHTDVSRVKLPKLDIPTFNGDLLNWKQFWEQFCVAVHNRTSISNAEKLAYLRNALKDGTAKSVIEGLSKTGEHYVEAV